MFRFLLPAFSAATDGPVILDPPDVPEPEIIEIPVVVESQMDSIFESCEKIFDFSFEIFDFIVSQPILLFLVGASIVPIGLSIFRIMKRSVK